GNERAGHARTRVLAAVDHCADLHPRSCLCCCVVVLSMWLQVFNYLMDGVEKAKNMKARTECLDECSQMIGRLGLTTCSQPKRVVPIVAKMVGSADGGIREKALTFLATVYSLVGEEVWAMVGGKDKCK